MHDHSDGFRIILTHANLAGKTTADICLSGYTRIKPRTFYVNDDASRLLQYHRLVLYRLRGIDDHPDTIAGSSHTDTGYFRHRPYPLTEISCRNGHSSTENKRQQQKQAEQITEPSIAHRYHPFNHYALRVPSPLRFHRSSGTWGNRYNPSTPCGEAHPSSPARNREFQKTPACR